MSFFCNKPWIEMRQEEQRTQKIPASSPVTGFSPEVLGYRQVLDSQHRQRPVLPYLPI